MENPPAVFPITGKCGRASLVHHHPDRVSSVVFAGLRRLHPSNPVTSNAAPTSRRAIRPACLSTPKHQGHLPDRRPEPAGRVLKPDAPGTAPASASRAVAGVGPSALRGLVIQSPNIIYQSDPFARRFASSAPPRLSALVSPFRPRTPVARYAMKACGLVCLRQTPGVLALHGARATPLPGRRWLRSSKTTHRTLARGTPTPKMSRALAARHRASKAVTVPACLKTGCGRNMLASAGREVGRLRTCFFKGKLE